jgi:lipid-A-disaccharide synthase
MADLTDSSFAPLPAGRRPDLLIIAGEHSGDQQAARMVERLRQLRPEVAVAALGGPALRSAGAHLLLDLTASSVVGLVEVIRHYGYFKTVFEQTVSWIRSNQPRAICFVDYPGFNLRLARCLRREQLTGPRAAKALYYISPQIWAWKAKRRFTMAEDLDALAVIFPFELACYADTRLPVSFVGHPFVEPGVELPARFDPQAPTLLLPGSRSAAVGRIAPALLEGFAAYRKHRPQAKAVMVYPSEEIRDCLAAEIAARPGLGDAVTLQSNEAPASGSAVLTSSGTMSLACALAGIPGAIAYRANPLTYALGRRLVKVPYLGIANLLLKQPMYPEFIQGAARPEALAGQLLASESEARRRETAGQAARLRDMLSPEKRLGPAEWILSVGLGHELAAES